MGARGMRGSGKPLRAILRFRLQDAQTPLLSLWKKEVGG
jgi:hypothetical protein